MQTLSDYNDAIRVPLEERYRRGELRFEEKDLTYSATERCSCGAGLARLPEKECTLRFWHCSRCLLEGINVAEGVHDDLKSFHRWDIQKEGPFAEIGLVDALSLPYRTTRPDAKVTKYTLTADVMDEKQVVVVVCDEATAQREFFRLGREYWDVHLQETELVFNSTQVGAVSCR